MTLRKLINTLESGSVIRYHALPNVRPQLNGHHTFGVFAIVMYLTRGRASRALIIETQMHDAGELISGDVPHSAKRDYPEYAAQCREVEDGARYRDMLFKKLPLSRHDYAVLKIADVLEGLIWCELHESKRGPFREDRWHATFWRKMAEYKDVLTVAEKARSELIFAAYTHRHVRPEKRLAQVLHLNGID